MARILWINPVGTGAYDAPIGEELRAEAAPGTRVDVCSLPGVGPSTWSGTPSRPWLPVPRWV